MSTSLFDLSDKQVLVTGGHKGLGLAIAKGLGRSGATLIINGRNTQSVENAVSCLLSEGIDATSAVFDVTDYASLQNNIDDILDKHNGIDVLVNNAGIMQRSLLDSMPITNFQQVVNTNMIAPFAVAQSVVKHMQTKKAGKIINICSIMSELAREGVGAYAAAKGGLKMLTRNMATEWAEDGIQVNAIGPGYYATDMTAALRTKGNPFNDFIESRIPAGRWGDPDELQGAAIFLASKASDFVNGQIIYVDGGLLATIGKPIE